MSAVADWHRSEPRAVRPFFSAKAAEEAVYRSTIRLFEGSAPSAEEVYDLDEVDLRKLAISVMPVLAEGKSWVPEGYKTQYFDIVVIARNSLIKKSVVLLKKATPSFKGEPVELTADELEELGGGRNLKIVVALCLNTDRKPKTGAPFVIGHWLSSKTFTIREKHLPRLFDIQPLKDEQWIEKGYPAKTFYSVEYISGISDEPSTDDVAGIATVYIHEDAYNRMAGQKLGETLQPILLAEILAQILEQSQSDWRDLTDIAKGSPLETFIKQLKGTNLASLDGLKNAVKQPSRLRAALQAHWNVLSAITSG